MTANCPVFATPEAVCLASQGFAPEYQFQVAKGVHAAVRAPVVTGVSDAQMQDYLDACDAVGWPT